MATAIILLAGCSSEVSPAKTDPRPSQELIVPTEAGAQMGEETVQVWSGPN